MHPLRLVRLRFAPAQLTHGTTFGAGLARRAVGEPIQPLYQSDWGPDTTPPPSVVAPESVDGGADGSQFEEPDARQEGEAEGQPAQPHEGDDEQWEQ